MKNLARVGGLAGILLGNTLTAAWAGDLVANPETVFEKGMSWTERNGHDKGVLQLNSNGSAIINWNGSIYWGSWEKVDEYRVKTTWESGGPKGTIWSLRATGDSAVPYVASRRVP